MFNILKIKIDFSIRVEQMFSPLNQVQYHNANTDRWLRFEVSLGTINKATMMVLGFHRQCHLIAKRKGKKILLTNIFLTTFS